MEPAELRPGEWQCPTCGRTCAPDFAVCPTDATPRIDGTKAGDPMIGEVLGRTYKVSKVLGQGGMARLYEAEHLRIDARYAIKIIHDDLAREPEMLVRFEREARAAGRIHSDHVVRLVDVLRTSDNRPALVTELLEGEDLQARLDRTGRLSVAEAIPIARQLCRAVADAHAAHVVHRDLKPSNVFLCNSDSGELLVKVFDFGVAKLEGDEKMTRTDAVMGTAAYMAPEQARSANDAGPLADVYSIGAVLYHMLCGVPPYGQVPALSRFALVLHEEPARPRSLEPTIPAGVEGVIQHAMARDRKLRCASAIELERQLSAFDVAHDAEGVPTVDSVPAPVSTTDNTAPAPLPGAATEVVRTPRMTAPSARQTRPSMTAATPPDAAGITIRARLARPVALTVAITSSVAAGAWLAVVLALIVGSTSTGERALITLFGFAAMGGVAALHIRGLSPKWSAAPAIVRHTQPYLRALVGGVVALGALELLSHASNAIFHGTFLGTGGRVIVAGMVGAIGLASRRFGLDETLRRRIS